jgi:hypothetical protein
MLPMISVGVPRTKLLNSRRFNQFTPCCQYPTGYVIPLFLARGEASGPHSRGPFRRVMARFFSMEVTSTSFHHEINESINNIITPLDLS